MPKAGSIKRITNPDDESQFFDVRLVDELEIKHGRGRIYQKRKIKFLNNEPNSRKVEAKTITHKALDKDGNPPPEDFGDVDDDSQRVVVELIKEVITKHGRGRIYQKNKTILDHDKDRNGRKTHRVRLRKDNTWLDIERTDQFTLRHGRGGRFRREKIRVKWDDDEFDATEGIPINEGPKDGFDPPWRLDPLQNIKNVKWDTYTRAGFMMTWAWDFTHHEEGETGPSCSPVVETVADMGEVWESGSVTYSFTPSPGSPTFTPSTPFITQSNTTLSGEPDEISGGSIDMAVGIIMNPDDDQHVYLAESADINMTKIVLSGETKCYGAPGQSQLGILQSEQNFTIPVTASGINATLLGKPHDNKSTTIFVESGTVRVVVGYSWRIPPGFDLSSGDPLP